MNKNIPLVSMITPGWNGVSFVHRLLNSILAQTYGNIEYIYVDDGSTDGTKDVVLSYKEKFKEHGISFYYIYKPNGGVASAVNEGLKKVQGEYLCWPEYDDILLPDAVENRVNYLETHSDCAVVTSDAWLVKENDIGKIIGVLSHKNPNRFDRNHFVQALLTNSIFTAACHMIRMSMFDKVNPQRHIFSSWIGPNWQMLLPVYYHYNRGFIETPGLYYVIRKNSISHSHDTFEKKKSAIKEYERILQAVLNKINMPEEDRDLYNRLIEEKYALDKMKLGLRYNALDLFYEGFVYYKENGNIPKKVFLYKILLEHRILKFFYLTARFVLNKVKR